MDTNRNKILGLKDVVSKANENLEQIKSLLNASGQTSEETSNYFKQINDKLPLISDQINHLQNAIKSSKDLVNSQKEQLININNEVNSDLTRLQTIIQNINDRINKLNNYSELKDQKEVLNEISNNLSEITNIVNGNITSLENSNQDILSDIADKFKEIIPNVANEENKIKQLEETNNVIDKATIAQLNELQNELNLAIGTLSNNFYTNSSNIITARANLLNSELDKVSTMLELTRIIQPQLQFIAGIGSASADNAASNAD